VLGRAVLPSTRLDFSRALMAAAQRAENRAVRAFRATHPHLSVALKGGTYGELADGEAPGRMQVGFTAYAAISVENEHMLKSDMLINTGTSLAGACDSLSGSYRSGRADMERDVDHCFYDLADNRVRGFGARRHEFCWAARSRGACRAGHRLRDTGLQHISGLPREAKSER